MPDPIFAELYRETERLTWDSTEQVRQRGRRRTLRARLCAALASAVAVAAIGTGAVTVAGRPDGVPPVPPVPTTTPAPSGTPGPSAGPTPSAVPPTPSSAPSSPVPGEGRPGSSAGTFPRTVPAAALLQPADLPAGFEMTWNDLAAEQSFEFVTSAVCGNRLPSILVGEVARRGVRFDSPTDGLHERVTRHSDDDAEKVLANVRARVTDCDPRRAQDSTSVLGTGLGGAESLLVEALDGGIPMRWLFVRQGDLVAQLRMAHDTTPAQARPYARKAAARLCAGTDAC